MTITATRQVLQDGAHNCTMLLTGVCDGNGGDEVAEKKVIVAELSPPCSKVSIICVDYEVSGGIARIQWDDFNDPKTVLELASAGNLNFEDVGGIPNPGASDSTNGNVVLTTVGFDIGSSYSIKLRLKKKYPPYSTAGTVPVGGY